MAVLCPRLCVHMYCSLIVTVQLPRDQAGHSLCNILISQGTPHTIHTPHTHHTHTTHTPHTHHTKIEVELRFPDQKCLTRRDGVRLKQTRQDSKKDFLKLFPFRWVQDKTSSRILYETKKRPRPDQDGNKSLSTLSFKMGKRPRLLSFTTWRAW